MQQVCSAMFNELLAIEQCGMLATDTRNGYREGPPVVNRRPVHRPCLQVIPRIQPHDAACNAVMHLSHLK